MSPMDLRGEFRGACSSERICKKAEVILSLCKRRVKLTQLVELREGVDSHFGLNELLFRYLNKDVILL